MLQKPGYPKQFKHLGDHVRARRINLGLDQKAVARRLGIATHTLRNWENGRTEPEVRLLPALIAFVDHNPLPRLGTRGQALQRRRLSLGLSQGRLAALAGVDEASVRRLEVDTHGMARRVRQAVLTALRHDEDLRRLPPAPGPIGVSDRSRANQSSDIQF